MSTLNVIFSLVLIPFADHSFVLAAIQSLYILKQSTYPKLFDVNNEV